MAERRMMSKKIIHSDAFLDLPSTTQNLYFHLLLEADDEGFVNSPKRIQRTIGASDIDSQLLIDKKFIILFESGVIVIKHWRIHNYIQNDRFKPTSYVEERAKLSIEKNDGYKMDTKCTPRIGEDSLGKFSLDEDNKESVEKKPKRFIPPTLEEIEEFIKTNNLNVNAKYFLDYFTDGNWIDSKGNKVKNWKQKLRTWHNHNDSKPKYRTLADSNREAMDAYEKRFNGEVIEGEVCEP